VLEAQQKNRKKGEIERDKIGAAKESRVKEHYFMCFRIVSHHHHTSVVFPTSMHAKK
jgi:hypothetical protein